MNVLVTGAHGKVGQEIMTVLDRSDHDATAMVRTDSYASDMAEYDAETVVADLTEDVSHAVRDHDGIIFAAGSSGEDVEGVDHDGAIRMIEGAEAHGVGRFVMLSAMNADEPESSPDALGDYLVVKQEADKRLRTSDLTDTIVRPGALTDEPATGEIRAAAKLDRGEITRADVARTLVAALDTAETHGKAFEILAGDEPIESALEHLTRGEQRGLELPPGFSPSQPPNSSLVIRTTRVSSTSRRSYSGRPFVRAAYIGSTSSPSLTP